MPGLEYANDNSKQINTETTTQTTGNGKEDLELDNTVDLIKNESVTPDGPVVPLERNDGNIFCGISTYNPCESDEDCIVTGCLNQVCQTKSEEEPETESSPKDCYDSEKYGYRCGCFDSHCKWG